MNITLQCEGLRQQHEEELCSTKNLSFQLEKATAEADSWRQKYQVNNNYISTCYILISGSENLDF